MIESIGARIKKLRDSQEMSQEDLAKILKLDRTSLSQIEHDKRPLKADELIALSKIFNISTDQLLGIELIPDIHLEVDAKGSPKETLSERISVPVKNITKFKQVLLYVLSKVGAKSNIGETVLYKLLYFIDFDYYEKYEKQLTGATYIKNHYGPTPIEFKKITEDMIKKGELELVKSQHFQHEQKKYLPCIEADLNLLNGNEIRLIDDVLDKLSNMNAATISEYSHKDVPWMVTHSGKPIDYETVFYRTAPYSVREYDDKEFL